MASIQIIQDIYPSIYSLAQDQLILTRDRVISKITGVVPAPVDRKEATPSQPTPPPITQPVPQAQPVAVTQPQSKSGLLMGLGIACAVLFGALVSNSFNKLPNSSPPVASNNTQAPASAPITQANSQTSTPSPAQAPIPLPTPASVVKMFWLFNLYDTQTIDPTLHRSIDKMILKSDNNGASQVLDYITRTKSSKSDLSQVEFQAETQKRKSINTFYQALST